MSHRKHHQRAISLAIICVFALAVAAVNLPASVVRALSFQQAKKRSPQKPAPVKPANDREALAKKPAPSGTVKDRLGEDDGYGIVVFYSATVHGNLEVCGCPIHPLGGVARRAGYINAFKQRSPDAAILQVDAGYIFSDDLDAAGNGKFKLSSVGENLVAITLPGNGGQARSKIKSANKKSKAKSLKKSVKKKG